MKGKKYYMIYLQCGVVQQLQDRKSRENILNKMRSKRVVLCVKHQPLFTAFQNRAERKEFFI